jgi:hypothetical protein
MLDNGGMASSTEKVLSHLHPEWKDKGIGRMEHGLVGQIMSDFM